VNEKERQPLSRLYNFWVNRTASFRKRISTLWLWCYPKAKSAL